MKAAELTRPKAREQRLWAYDELLVELPESNLPMELWDGEIVMSPTPNPVHQTIVGAMYREMDGFVRDHKVGRVFLSPLDVVLSEHRVVQPDVLFISNANRSIIQDSIRGVPDLVVEVVSRGSWKRDRVEKKALYEQVGIVEYWIIDPENRSIEVFVLAKGVFQLHCRAAETEMAKSKRLAGFRVSFPQLVV